MRARQSCRCTLMTAYSYRPFAIEFLPAQVEDFAETAAGEQQKADSRGGIRRDPGAPIAL